MYEQFEDKVLQLTLHDLEEIVFEQTNMNYRYVVFADYERNNFIIFTPKTSKCNIQTIVTKTDPIAYEYLLDNLEYEENLVVEWYQDNEEETSGYTIYFDVNLTDSEKVSYLKIKDRIDNIAEDSVGEFLGLYNEVYRNFIVNLDETVDFVEYLYSEELGDYVEDFDDDSKDNIGEDTEGDN